MSWAVLCRGTYRAVEGADRDGKAGSRTAGRPGLPGTGRNGKARRLCRASQALAMRHVIPCMAHSAHFVARAAALRSFPTGCIATRMLLGCRRQLWAGNITERLGAAPRWRRALGDRLIFASAGAGEPDRALPATFVAPTKVDMSQYPPPTRALTKGDEAKQIAKALSKNSFKVRFVEACFNFIEFLLLQYRQMTLLSSS